MVSRKKIVAVIGVSDPTSEEKKLAYELGKKIAEKGWTLINGGLCGVMEESARGASEKNGVVIGILPGPSTIEANSYVTYPIATNMGHGRNVIIAHTADVLIAIGKGYGTLSEISIGLKLGKKVISLKSWNVEGITPASSVEQAVSTLP